MLCWPTADGHKGKTSVQVGIQRAVSWPTLPCSVFSLYYSISANAWANCKGTSVPASGEDLAKEECLGCCYGMVPVPLPLHFLHHKWMPWQKVPSHTSTECSLEPAPPSIPRCPLLLVRSCPRHTSRSEDRYSAPLDCLSNLHSLGKTLAVCWSPISLLWQSFFRRKLPVHFKGELMRLPRSLCQ